MKKWLASVLAACLILTLCPIHTEAASGDLTINASNFPDAAFRNYVSQNFDKNSDGALSTSEIAAVKKISVTGMGITTLEGLAYFTSLTELYCASNQLTSLDISGNPALEQLYCYKNAKLTSLKNVNSHSYLKSLDLQDNTSLTYLECRKCALTYLNVSGCTKLSQLFCDNNNLASLNLSNTPALKSLYIFDNKLTSLDLSKCTELQNLNCMRNQLTALSVAQNQKLAMLLCDSNQLTTLDVSEHASLSNLSVYNNKKLTELDCAECSLTTLSVRGCTALSNLDCSDNQLKELNVSECTSLFYLNCSRNQLTQLDVSKNTGLGTLFCAENYLTDIDVTANTSLRYLDCSDNKLNKLNVLNNTQLTYLACYHNNIVILTIQSCPNILTAYTSGTKTTTTKYVSYIYNSYYLYVDSGTLIRRRAFNWTRLAGSDRYGTMAVVAQTACANHSCPTIIVATGQKFPDALAGTALAGVYGCPIILTKTATLSPEAASEIKRLAASTCKVLILGGTGTVSQKVEDSIRSLGISGLTVERVAGSNREATAIEVYKKGKSAGGFKSGGTVIIATGYAFADSLSISPYAYASKTPILLAKKDGSLSADTKSLIESEKFTKAIIIGGTGAVSDATEQYLSKTRGMTVIRISGSNRYATSANIMKWELGMQIGAAVKPEVSMYVEGMGIATGANFADALGSVGLLGWTKSPLLLVSDSNKTNKTITQENITALVKANHYDMLRGYIFGGTGTVSATIEGWLNNAVK